MTELDLRDQDVMGPVAYLVVEFPGNKMNGEGLAALIDLVERGIMHLAVRGGVVGGDAFGAVEIQIQEAPCARRVARVALDLREDAVTNRDDAVEPIAELAHGDAARRRLDAAEPLVGFFELPCDR